MYIKRQVINEVGLFDSKTFQRGYGEENDFCFRAQQLGYHDVLCDDTYIYHSGSVSFTNNEEKRRLIQSHERILEDRYPLQMQKNREYVRDNPHQYLRDNIDLYASIENGKKNLFFLLHSDFRVDSQDNVGGTQFHVKDLVSRFRILFNVFVASRDGDSLAYTIYTEDCEKTLKYFIGPRKAFPVFHDVEISKILRNILSGFHIDLIHVQHVVSLSFDIFGIAREMKIPVILTLHDYYYICPTTNLFSCDNERCDKWSDKCKKCLHERLNYSEEIDYIAAWRTNCLEALRSCEVILTPSQSTKEIYTRFYSEILEKIIVIPHGLDAFTPALLNGEAELSEKSQVYYYIDKAFDFDNIVSGWAFQTELESKNADIFLSLRDSEGRQELFLATKKIRQDVANTKNDERYLWSGFSVSVPDCVFCSGDLSARLYISNSEKYYRSDPFTLRGYVRKEKKRPRIAFLGGQNKIKGSDVVYQLISQSSAREYDWYVIGGCGDEKIASLEKKNLRKLGWYSRETVKTILVGNKIDLVCILPVAAETFCYTLSESLMAGIPVLARDIGALGERLRGSGLGWLVPADADHVVIKEKIDEILSNQNDYALIRESVSRFRHKSVSEMISEYLKIYEAELDRVSDEERAFDPAIILNRSKESQIVYQSRNALLEDINYLQTQINLIQSSTAYRVALFFSTRSKWIKEPLKTLAQFFFKIADLFSK